MSVRKPFGIGQLWKWNRRTHLTYMDKKYLAQFIKPIKESLLNSGFTIEVIIENVAVDELPLVRIVLDSSESNDCFRVYGLACDIYMPNSDHSSHPRPLSRTKCGLRFPFALLAFPLSLLLIQLSICELGRTPRGPIRLARYAASPFSRSITSSCILPEPRISRGAPSRFPRISRLWSGSA